jgi:hypothetical protein
MVMFAVNSQLDAEDSCGGGAIWTGDFESLTGFTESTSILH